MVVGRISKHLDAVNEGARLEDDLADKSTIEMVHQILEPSACKKTHTIKERIMVAARKPKATKSRSTAKKTTAKAKTTRKPAAAKKVTRKAAVKAKSTRTSKAKSAKAPRAKAASDEYLKFSGKFTVRLPKSLHQALVERAEKEGVSLNLFVTNALSRTVAMPGKKR